jgi:hypothetical protein
MRSRGIADYKAQGGPAWHNKISHAQNKLVLMTADFSPDVAEEIRIASRSFMRRLATDLPK